MAAQNEPTLEKYKWRNGGIINPLFDGLTYNTSGHFAHCSYFYSPLRGSENTTQLAKYPRVLYVKPSNKVYVLSSKCSGLCYSRAQVPQPVTKLCLWVACTTSFLQKLVRAGHPRFP